MQMNDASAEVHFWREADVRREIDVAKCYEETSRPVCTENYIRVYQVTESAKLAQW
jgi:hypothetical protein